MMRVFYFFLFSLLFEPVTWATGIDFDVDSDSYIYACDAGIRHKNHTDRICFDRDSQDACDPGLCNNQVDCNCICSGGTTNNDQERLDLIQLRYKTWSENSNSNAPTTHTVVFATGENFSRVFTANNEWNKQITQINFNLGSERYGSEFYLDVCYRGPVVEYFDMFKNYNGPAWKFPNHLIKLQVTLTDLATSEPYKYSQLADLKMKMTTTCDVQGEGQHKYATGGNQISDVSGGDKNYFTNYASFGAGGTLVLLDDWINYGNGKTPRFCKIRYSFIENRRNNTSNPLSQIRKRNQHKSRISTFSKIEQNN